MDGSIASRQGRGTGRRPGVADVRDLGRCHVRHGGVAEATHLGFAEVELGRDADEASVGAVREVRREVPSVRPAGRAVGPATYVGVRGRAAHADLRIEGFGRRVARRSIPERIHTEHGRR